MKNNKVFDAIDAQPAQLRANYADEMRQDVVPSMGKGITSVVFAGMGGSALAGNVFKNWLFDRVKVPFEVVRGYSLPGHINPHSLIICSSYSGNTEETLSAYEYAKKMNAQIVVIASGGELAERASSDGNWLLKLPGGLMQPRFALLAGLKALACLMEDLGLVDGAELRRELLDVADFLDVQKGALSVDDQKENLASTIASQLTNKTVLIYGSPVVGSAAYKWKVNINESAKQQAYYNTFPELDHNELEGWSLPREKNLGCILLRSDLDTNQIKKRIEATTEVLQQNEYNPIIIDTVGTTRLQHLLYAAMLGDYVAAYLAELNDVDAGAVPLVDQLKAKLK